MSETKMGSNKLIIHQFYFEITTIFQTYFFFIEISNSSYICNKRNNKLQVRSSYQLWKFIKKKYNRLYISIIKRCTTVTDSEYIMMLLDCRNHKYWFNKLFGVVLTQFWLLVNCHAILTVIIYINFNREIRVEKAIGGRLGKGSFSSMPTRRLLCERVDGQRRTLLTAAALFPFRNLLMSIWIHAAAQVHGTESADGQMQVISKKGLFITYRDCVLPSHGHRHGVTVTQQMRDDRYVTLALCQCQLVYN